MFNNAFSLIFIFLILLFQMQTAKAEALIGKISKEGIKVSMPQVIDANTNMPIQNALVFIPKENQKTYTNQNGEFSLSSSKKTPVILSIQKDGYKPYSQTLKSGVVNNSMKFKLEKISPLNSTISSQLLHLGDNAYSENSSGACYINAPCVGPEFRQNFSVKKLAPKSRVYLEIGSVIGIDTIQAMKLGQNNLTNASSSPLELFVNNQKIGELKINGDGQKIPIPSKILNSSGENILTIKTGVNQTKTDIIDYDDVELMNISILVKE